MQTTKKKPSLIFILVGAVLAGYLGYLINGAWTEGIAFNEFMDRFNEVCAVPFANYYNSNTVKAVAIALGIYAMAIVMYYTSQRNYMPGKEFGTARFENPKQVNKILADKDENFNRILSQNVKMSLDFRRLKLNGNILICGGSGAGKTFYEVKPNLMQMPHNCSFICTDPKGEILRSCGQMLKNNGYNVKVINLLEMDKSDCYNPFSYIREETDVVKLITNLISNTTPKGATPSDPFWEKAEGLFLQAIFYYVWLEVQPAKRNFETGDNNMTSYTEAIKRELKQLNDYGQISEIKETELNSTILSHLEMSNDLVDAVKTDWNAKGIFKRIEKEEDKQIVVDSYCTRPYVQDVILRYCQNRSIFKTKFAIIDGMLLE